MVKTDRFDPLEITEVARSIISLVDRVRDHIQSLTRDIVFPSDKSTARTLYSAPVAVKTEEHNVAEGIERSGVDDDAMRADYEESEEGDDQVQDPDDNDMVVVKDEDEDEGGVLHMYGGSLIQPLATQICKPVSTAVKGSSAVFTTADKVKLEKSIKQIASRVLGATDPHTNLETEEAQKCIYETASRACESTVAGRLRDVFPSANLTEEVVVEIYEDQRRSAT